LHRWLRKDPYLGLVTIPKRPPRSALGGTLRAFLSESLDGSHIEDKDVNFLDNTPTITYFYKRKENMINKSLSQMNKERNIVRYTYIITDEDSKSETIYAMSFKRMLKKLDKTKTFWVTYENKKGNPQTKVIVNGKEQKNIHA